MIMTDPTERAARAIAAVWGHRGETGWRAMPNEKKALFREAARAALTAAEVSGPDVRVVS